MTEPEIEDHWAEGWHDRARQRVLEVEASWGTRVTAQQGLDPDDAPFIPHSKRPPVPFKSKRDPAGPAQAWDPKNQTRSTWREMGPRRQDFTHPLSPDDTHATDEETEQYLSEMGVPDDIERPPARKLQVPELVVPIDLTHMGDQGQKNIEAVLAMATPQELDYWRQWYFVGHRAAVILARKNKTDLMTAAATIAVLSPKEDWNVNLELADAALSGNWEDVGTLPDNRAKAYSIVHDRDFSVIRGEKIFPFFLSIFDPQKFQEEVVVDTHAASIWLGLRNGTVPGINDTVRAKMTEDYAKAGAKFGLSPQEAQALAWALWRFIPAAKAPKKPKAPKTAQSPGPNLFWEDAQEREGAAGSTPAASAVRFRAATPEEFEQGIQQVNQSALDADRDYTLGAKLFISEDGAAGYAISPEGELKWGWSTKPGYGVYAMRDGVQRGGTHLSALDNGRLVQLYDKLGFKPYQREKNWTPGEPDVVHMRLPRGDSDRAKEPGTQPVSPGPAAGVHQAARLGRGVGGTRPARAGNGAPPRTRSDARRPGTTRVAADEVAAEDPEIQTLPLLAGAYRGKRTDLANMLTHTLVTGADKTLCGRISADHMCDYTETPDVAPTCPACAKRDPRFSGTKKTHVAVRGGDIGMREMERWNANDRSYALLSAVQGGSLSERKDRHAELLQDLQQLGLKHEDVRGQWEEASSGKMRAEPSLWVKDIDLETALALGRKYDQDAVIWKSPEGVVGMYDLRSGTVRVPSKGSAPVFGTESVSTGPKGPKVDGRPNPSDQFARAKSMSFGVNYDFGDEKSVLPWDGKTPVTRRQVETHYGPATEKAAVVR